MDKILLILLITFIIISIIFQAIFNSFEFFNPTKCFSCEKELPHNKKYLAYPSKCFSCEQQYIKNNINPIYSQPTKCFSCGR